MHLLVWTAPGGVSSSMAGRLLRAAPGNFGRALRAKGGVEACVDIVSGGILDGYRLLAGYMLF